METRNAGQTLTHADLAGLVPSVERVLVRPSSPWQAVADAVLRPLLGGGSAVVVAGDVDDAELARIAASEKAGPGLE